MERKTLSPQGARRRSELMDAAVRLAARNGFSRTRVSDIVGRVGVGQGVFYWYFESKEAMYREIMADNVRRLRRFQGAFITAEPDPIRRVAKGILATMDFVVHNRHVFALLDHSAGQNRFQQQRTEGRRAHVLDTVRHVQEAMELGLVRRTDPEYSAQAIAGVVDRLARVFLGAEIRADVDRVAQEAIDFCVAGLLGAPTITVAELRAEIEMTPELVDLRDRVGAGSDEPAA
jgi:AcrR family transcriptional regulator